MSPLEILRAGGRVRVTDEAASKVLEAQRAEEPTQYGL
jgi:hypothetical protein